MSAPTPNDAMHPCWAGLPPELKAQIANWSIPDRLPAHIVKVADSPHQYTVYKAQGEEWNTVDAFINGNLFRADILKAIAQRTTLYVEIWKGPQPPRSTALERVSSIPTGMLLQRIDTAILSRIKNFSIADLDTMVLRYVHKEPYIEARRVAADPDNLDWSQVTKYTINFSRGAQSPSIITFEAFRTKDLRALLPEMGSFLPSQIYDTTNGLAAGLRSRSRNVLRRPPQGASTEDVLGRMLEAFQATFDEGSLKIFVSYDICAEDARWGRKDSAELWEKIRGWGSIKWGLLGEDGADGWAHRIRDV